MFHIRVENRTYDQHRPKGCTVLCIEVAGWPGNEFDFWLPEAVFINSPEERAWGNWMADPFQDWQVSGEQWVSTKMLAGFSIRSELTLDPERACLWHRHTFSNTGSTPLRNLSTQNCFHLVNAPRFISIRGERLWAHLDGAWTTTDTVPRRESPDPRRVVFWVEGSRTERTVMPLPGFPRAVMPQAATSALFIAESFDGQGSVGIASRNLQWLFNNNDPILRCLHSEAMPISVLAPGETAQQEGVIVFSRGNHDDAIRQYHELVSGLPGWR